jgi:membrane-associated protease RseP (regulator of RpoE activity)
MNPEQLGHARALDENPLPPVRRNLILFLLTVVSVFYVGGLIAAPDADGSFAALLNPKYLAHAATFAVPLLAILLTHEFGHFFAARYHRVPASFPYFIPFPFFPFGTMGAVIAMQGPIRSRNALLDVGASGPLAGLVVAVPTLFWGLAQSTLIKASTSNYTQEGQSLFYWLAKRLVFGPIPEGHDVLLHPTAFAAWGGLFLTMLNLLPWGQLDGGHIVYSLLGERHHTIALWLRRSLLALFAFNFLRFVEPVLLGRSEMPLAFAISNSTFWLVWFVVLGIIGKVSGDWRHPPCEVGALSRWRRAVGWLCMGLFVALFMPTPLTQY